MIYRISARRTMSAYASYDDVADLEIEASSEEEAMQKALDLFEDNEIFWDMDDDTVEYCDEGSEGDPRFEILESEGIERRK